MTNIRGIRCGTSASCLLVALTLAVEFFTMHAHAAEEKWEDDKRTGIDIVIESIRPLPVSVKKYDELLSGLDTNKIASIVTALDAYKERFQNAPQVERDKAFVLFYLFYLYTAEHSNELECSGLEESPDHIPNLQKTAEKAGLTVFRSVEGSFLFGPKQYFLLQTFQDIVSPSLVEFLKLKTRDLQLGFADDGGYTLSISEMGDRCVQWETYVCGFPNSLMKVVAQIHYERDLDALMRSDIPNSPHPYSYEEVAPTTLEKTFLAAYQRIIRIHPDTPLADLLRKYLDLLSKSDTIERKKREAFFAQYKALENGKGARFPINFGESCRWKAKWDDVRRECLAYAAPAVGVVDTESGKATRVKYGKDGIAYPGDTYKKEYVFPCIWSDTTFYTMIEVRQETSPADSVTTTRPKQWAVRQFDGQAHLLGITPLSPTKPPISFGHNYLYRPEVSRVLGPEVEGLDPQAPRDTVVGGPTADGYATLHRTSQAEGGVVTARSFTSDSRRVLFEDENLAHARVSPDMRFVAAVLDYRSKRTSELRVIDTISGENKLLGDAGGFVDRHVPDWSPDSKTMACQRQEDFDHDVILVYSVDTGELRKLVPDACKGKGFIRSVFFLDKSRLLVYHWIQKADLYEWVAMDIATGKTLWTLRDSMEYMRVFDSGKKIACFFPEARR